MVLMPKTKPFLHTSRSIVEHKLVHQLKLTQKNIYKIQDITRRNVNIFSLLTSLKDRF